MSARSAETPLARLIAEAGELPVPSAVNALARAARERHGPGIAAVLFYGSCLREPDARDRMIDLYLLADSYAEVHRGWLMRALNALLPPNIYYIEARLADQVARAKYALVALTHFEKLVSPATCEGWMPCMRGVTSTRLSSRSTPIGRRTLVWWNSVFAWNPSS